MQVAVYDPSICDYFEVRSVTGGDFSCNLQLETQRERFVLKQIIEPRIYKV